MDTDQDVNKEVIYLREKSFKDHSIVIRFFGIWSVERKDVRRIEHHSVSDL